MNGAAPPPRRRRALHAIARCRLEGLQRAVDILVVLRDLENLDQPTPRDHAAIQHANIRVPAPTRRARLSERFGCHPPENNPRAYSPACGAVTPLSVKTSRMPAAMRVVIVSSPCRHRRHHLVRPRTRPHRPGSLYVPNVTSLRAVVTCSITLDGRRRPDRHAPPIALQVDEVPSPPNIRSHHRASGIRFDLIHDRTTFRGAERAPASGTRIGGITRVVGHAGSMSRPRRRHRARRTRAPSCRCP